MFTRVTPPLIISNGSVGSEISSGISTTKKPSVASLMSSVTSGMKTSCTWTVKKLLGPNVTRIGSDMKSVLSPGIVESMAKLIWP